tara:strand:- start:228 stop:461 length:234 start_codon:yes stop_codon:yes gene_type:complete
LVAANSGARDSVELLFKGLWVKELWSDETDERLPLSGTEAQAVSNRTRLTAKVLEAKGGLQRELVNFIIFFYQESVG